MVAGNFRWHGSRVTTAGVFPHRCLGRLESMLSALPHPAVLRLLVYQSKARAARAVRGFRGSRRAVLSCIALLLAVAWGSQVFVALLLREPADRQELSAWMTTGLLGYTLWHLLKTACRTPVEPFEWTAAEREWLGAGPLRRYDRIVYRFISIATAAAAKAACFSLVMLPDITIWAAGFAGMFLALLFVDLVRIGLEISAYGVSRATFTRCRCVVLTLTAGCVLWTLRSAVPLPASATESQLPPALGIGLHMSRTLLQLRTSWIGVLAEAPFAVFPRVVLTPSVSIGLVADLLIAVMMVVMMAGLLLVLDGHMLRRRASAERRNFRHLQPVSLPKDTAQIRRVPRRMPWRMCGIGSLAWRQAIGVYHYRMQVFASLIVPAVLSSLTLLAPDHGASMLAQVVGGLVFYTFLLLPTALKFDFRRDVDRMTLIKSLPASPTAVTVGQLIVPVLICTVFQLSVLLAAMAVRPYRPVLLLAALAVLIPANVLIFALENVFFLLYPYRLNQEGLTIFLRSILAFTAKSILFLIALGVTVAWIIASRHIAHRFDSAGPCAQPLIFVTGAWALMAGAAAMTTAMLIAVYRRFDPSQDAPDLS